MANSFTSTSLDLDYEFCIKNSNSDLITKEYIQFLLFVVVVVVVVVAFFISVIKRG